MFSHVALNCTDLAASLRFYLAVLEPLGFTEADGAPGEYVRLTNGVDAVLVLCQVEPRFLGQRQHRKMAGVHHVALAVPSVEALDRVEAHLAQLGVRPAGDGRMVLRYRRGYHGLMVEDPDRVLVEIVWHDAAYFGRGPV
jgi:catechol 2,3-dioxygenase-like lactoylglutathione lyase family enzyme